MEHFALGVWCLSISDTYRYPYKDNICSFNVFFIHYCTQKGRQYLVLLPCYMPPHSNANFSLLLKLFTSSFFLYACSIHLLNAERRDAEWPNAEWPNAERPNTELDPTPNRDPTPNDRTPNDQTPKGTERRKTEHRIWTSKDWTPKKFSYHLWRILKFSRHPLSWVVRPNLGDDDWT
jgi:hypothetical protein